MRWGLVLAATMLSVSAEERDRSLAEFAAEADLIAVVRVEQTDYVKTREFPSSGSAFLKVLIPYKGALTDQWIEVTERGLAEDACYYPEPGVWQLEGDRFLVFLRKTADGQDRYRGRAPGCRLPVLVTEDNRYALRYPLPGVRISDPTAIAELVYADPAAYVDAGELTRTQIAELVNDYKARPVESDDPLAPPRTLYVYTLGIPIDRVRELMFPENPAG